MTKIALAPNKILTQHSQMRRDAPLFEDLDGDYGGGYYFADAAGMYRKKYQRPVQSGGVYNFTGVERVTTGGTISTKYFELYIKPATSKLYWILDGGSTSHEMYINFSTGQFYLGLIGVFATSSEIAGGGGKWQHIIIDFNNGILTTNGVEYVITTAGYFQATAIGFLLRAPTSNPFIGTIGWWNKGDTEATAFRYNCEETRGLASYPSTISGSIRNIVLGGSAESSFHAGSSELESMANSIGFNQYRQIIEGSQNPATFDLSIGHEITFDFKSTDTTGVMIWATLSVFHMVFSEGGAGAINAGGFTGSIYIDDVLFTGTTRGDLHTAICDDEWHAIRFVAGSAHINVNMFNYSTGSFPVTGSVKNWILKDVNGVTLQVWDETIIPIDQSGDLSTDIFGTTVPINYRGPCQYPTKIGGSSVGNFDGVLYGTVPIVVTPFINYIIECAGTTEIDPVATRLWNTLNGSNGYGQFLNTGEFNVKNWQTGLFISDGERFELVFRKSNTLGGFATLNGITATKASYQLGVSHNIDDFLIGAYSTSLKEGNKTFEYFRVYSADNDGNKLDELINLKFIETNGLVVHNVAVDRPADSDCLITLSGSADGTQWGVSDDQTPWALTEGYSTYLYPQGQYTRNADNIALSADYILSVDVLITKIGQWYLIKEFGNHRFVIYTNGSGQLQIGFSGVALVSVYQTVVGERINITIHTSAGFVNAAVNNVGVGSSGGAATVAANRIDFFRSYLSDTDMRYAFTHGIVYKAIWCEQTTDNITNARLGNWDLLTNKFIELSFRDIEPRAFYNEIGAGEKWEIYATATFPYNDFVSVVYPRDEADPAKDVAGYELAYIPNQKSLLPTTGNTVDRNFANAPELAGVGISQGEDITYEDITADISRFYNKDADNVVEDVLVYGDDYLKEPIAGSVGNSDGNIYGVIARQAAFEVNNFQIKIKFELPNTTSGVPFCVYSHFFASGVTGGWFIDLQTSGIRFYFDATSIYYTSLIWQDHLGEVIEIDFKVVDDVPILKVTGYPEEVEAPRVGAIYSGISNIYINAFDLNNGSFIRMLPTGNYHHVIFNELDTLGDLVNELINIPFSEEAGLTWHNIAADRPSDSDASVVLGGSADGTQWLLGENKEYHYNLLWGARFWTDLVANDGTQEGGFEADGSNKPIGWIISVSWVPYVNVVNGKIEATLQSANFSYEVDFKPGFTYTARVNLEAVTGTIYLAWEFLSSNEGRGIFIQQGFTGNGEKTLSYTVPHDTDKTAIHLKILLGSGAGTVCTVVTATVNKTEVVYIPGDPANPGFDVNGDAIDNQEQVDKYARINRYIKR